MIPIAPLMTVGKFLWRYKAIIGVVVAVLVIGGTIWLDKRKIESLTKQNTKLEQANEEYAATLIAVQESHKAQVEALANETIAERARAESLNSILLEVENNDETVQCSVPDFVRDAFERM